MALIVTKVTDIMQHPYGVLEGSELMTLRHWTKVTKSRDAQYLAGVAHCRPRMYTVRPAVRRYMIAHTSLGHVNMYPWKHVPLDFENREILSTL